MAEKLSERLEARPNRVYAAEWNDCIYESGFSVLSLHLSMAEAWRAGRRKAFAQAVEDRETTLLTGFDFSRRSWAFRVKAYDVMPLPEPPEAE